MVTISYMVARAFQKSGQQGVGKRPKGDLCMARLREMMSARLRETGMRK